MTGLAALRNFPGGRAARSPRKEHAMSTAHFVSWLQGLIAPLLLGAVGIGAVFFLFQREVTRFAQFILLAVAVAVVFYTPGIIEWMARGITAALGVH
jgi:hypothetical protein